MPKGNTAFFTQAAVGQICPPHCKKSFSIFPSPSRMSLTKLSLGGNYDVIYKLFLPRESLVSDIPAGDGKIDILFLQCRGSMKVTSRQHRMLWIRYIPELDRMLYCTTDSSRENN
jgi:hypothetical protein